jgi:hypothetical protein
LKNELEQIRQALIKLKPSGPDGFEGLMAVVLSRITGHDFSLAKSGSQLGKDGSAIASPLSISFEGKRYDNKIDDNDILTKITQLAASDTPPEIWILGATVEVSTQTMETAEAAARQFGVEIVQLDWSNASECPPLVAALAGAPNEVIRFLSEHITDQALVNAAASGLELVSKALEVQAALDRLQVQLKTPALSLATATAANGSRLNTLFADRARAKSVLGQPLCPSAPSAIATRPRPQLTSQMHDHLAAAPAEQIMAIVGGEGFGKSWAFAQSWLELESRPLALLVPATDLRPEAVPYGSVDGWLIERFIQQTGDIKTDDLLRRWERRLKSWRKIPTGGAIRFVVCIDGLNQQPTLDWARFLNGLCAIVTELGGHLFVTSRQGYFDKSVKTALAVDIVTIQVLEWSDAELDEILVQQGVDPKSVLGATRASLKNPRLLGIACDLKAQGSIIEFSELNAERLLFEHIRASEADGTSAETASQFSSRLAHHANDVLNRVRRQETEDRLIFELSNGNGYLLGTEMAAVVSERFFVTLPEDQSLYQLAEPGLSLALGIALIKALQKGERNSRDIPETLELLIEPIAALDKTADAMFSAMIVASVDGECSDQVKAALIHGFVKLQNVLDADGGVFVGIIRNAIEASMLVINRVASDSQQYLPQKDWLIEALRQCRRDENCWPTMSKHISEWLRTYSRSPDVAMSPRFAHTNTEEAKAEFEKCKEKLTKKTEAMTEWEQAFLADKLLERDDLDPSVLHEIAFEWLAGVSLAPFAEDLIASAFSRCFNSGWHSPYDEFAALLRFNSVDWAATLEASIGPLTELLQSENSSTSKWAGVSVLRGLGDIDLGEQAEAIFHELTKDREHFGPWRLIETYCDVDPCDPATANPTTINRTVERCRDIDREAFAQDRWMGESEHFLRDALPGLVRFAPDTAAHVWQSIATVLANSIRETSYIGITELESNCSVLSETNIKELLDFILVLCNEGDAHPNKNKNNWLAIWFTLNVCFPHMTGDAQVDFMLGLSAHGPPLLSFADVLKAPSRQKLEAALQQAISTNDNDCQLALLMFAGCKGEELTDESKAYLNQLLEDENTVVRSQAMQAICTHNLTDSIQRLLDNGWTSAGLHEDNNHSEIWYGSQVIVRAAKLGFVPGSEVLKRISPRFYGTIAREREQTGKAELSRLLSASVNAVLGLKLPFQPPEIEEIDQDSALESSKPIFKKLSNLAETSGPLEFFKALNETDDEFQQRQKQAWRSFEAFQAALGEKEARTVIESAGYASVSAWVENAPQDASECAEALIGQNEAGQYELVNFGLMLARALSFVNPSLARRLYAALSDRKGFRKIVCGLSAYPFEAKCIWESADCSELDDTRALRLENAKNDHELAQEVLAAIKGGKQHFLDGYVAEGLKSLQPALIARALMILGFGLSSEETERVLVRYLDIRGFAGKAARAAKYANDRNKWAHHWYSEMAKTKSKIDFWRYSVLFLKIVDGRFDVWFNNVGTKGAVFCDFWPTIDESASKRAKAWKSKREKTFCGEKVPAEIYLRLDE